MNECDLGRENHFFTMTEADAFQLESQWWMATSFLATCFTSFKWDSATSTWKTHIFRPFEESPMSFLWTAVCGYLAALHSLRNSYKGLNWKIILSLHIDWCNITSDIWTHQVIYHHILHYKHSIMSYTFHEIRHLRIWNKVMEAEIKWEEIWLTGRNACAMCVTSYCCFLGSFIIEHLTYWHPLTLI